MFQVERLYVAFQKDGGIQKVLQDIFLQIQHGQWITILGHNGSGKSTLAKVLTGIVEPSYGVVNRDLHGPVQMVFQNPDAQIVGETVSEDILFGLENYNFPLDQCQERVAKALQQVGLSGYEQVPVGILSGGQKQLLCLASAIAVDPHVIILDEATSMLDPASRQRIRAVMKEWHSLGKTIVWLTQDMEEVVLGQVVVVLSEGRLAYQGTPRQFFYAPLSNQMSACRMLNFKPPFVVEVVEYLRKDGLAMAVEDLPIKPEELSKVVTRR